MATNVLEIAIEAAKIATNPAGYLLERIVKNTSKNVSKAEARSQDDIAALRLEAERQELEMRMAEAQARVAQEVAIARRIQMAEEVEMKEYYDYSGEGSLGGKFDGQNLSIGASGSGRRVSKRVFKFKGNVSLDLPNETGAEVVRDEESKTPVDASQ